MMTIRGIIKDHPVLCYFILTFAISWTGILLVIGGPAGFTSTPERAMSLMPPAVLALTAGPSAAGLLMTALVSGRAGLRDLWARIQKWRMGARWYAVALLTVPVVFSAILLALSRLSPDFLPAVITSGDKATLIIGGLMFGLLGGVLEELGWTGFAVPRLRERYGTLAAGVLVGVPWQGWHLLVNTLVAIGSRGTMPLDQFLPLYFLAAMPQLVAFRVLLVWVHDRTGSLLVVMLMHASLTASTALILLPPAAGAAMLVHILGFAAALWALVTVALTLDGGRQLRQPVGGYAA